ncbi:MAG: methyltransferase [Sphingomonadaceae bacterium]|nr:methyltransferase [Sphingomonadaceae bacterium]
MLEAAGVLVPAADGWRSRVRVARLDGRLFLHSAYPTDAPDAVFLGPDSYRFARLIRAELADWRGGGTLVDIGTGAGVGAVVACGVARPDRVIASDINPMALELAAVSAAHAGCAVTFVAGRDLPDVGIDLAVANPPFLVDDGERAYRHGGAMRGCGVALDMATAALRRLNRGGRLVLYTGSPIVGGRDDFRAHLADAAGHAGATLRYDEIDPDIFGEELDRPAYAGVERIALVAAIATKA